MAKNLIVFGKSATTDNLNDLALVSHGLEDCEIAFLEDAVLAAINPAFGVDIKHKSYALMEDIEARGLGKDQIHNLYSPISYGELIDLIDTATRVISIL